MNSEHHETVEGLRRLLSGEASAAESEQAAMHLLSCRDCALLAARALGAQKAKGKIGASGSLRLVIDLHEMQQARISEAVESQGAWAEIRSLPTKARRDKVRLTRPLHKVSFVEALLEEGAAAPPKEGEEILHLALIAVTQLTTEKISLEMKNDLCAECCAEIANARRRRTRWNAAREALKNGNAYVERGTQNGVAEGTILCVAGALEDDLGNSEEAARLLRRAVALFEAAAQPSLRNRTLAQLAYVLADPDPAESLRAAEACMSQVSTADPRLTFFAENTRVNCLLTMGACEEALLRFADLQIICENFREPYIQLRKRYTAARILEHLGRHAKAAALFQDVIAGDLEHGLIKDLFLDLAYLFGFHLRRGKPTDAIAVCRRAIQELSLLDDEEGSSEPARDQMRRVWHGLEEEVKQGNAELAATTVLRNYIKAHWSNPATDPPFVKG
jgi:tetratricopeptide (TPR) repeat protein